MKPRLFRAMGRWYCGCLDPIGPVGTGRTPRAAYDAWDHYMKAPARLRALFADQSTGRTIRWKPMSAR